ncbi:MAG: alpha/beta fold hydrolase [Anaerolineales bacterium]
MEKSELSSKDRLPVICVPGGVMPAELAYGPLLEALRDDVQPILKDLEVYATESPPPDFGLQLEVEGIRRAADAAGFKSFHLVGYSGGGASSLAFAAKYPERLRSLALIEPAWIGNEDWTAEDVADWAELDRVMALPAEERSRAFAHWQMRPGVEPPALPIPPGPPPAWMAKRPAGLEAFARAFKSYHLDRATLNKFQKPVYYALGSLSRSFYERNASTLAGIFPDIRVEVYEGRSHFDPPHRAEPERFAWALDKLWARGVQTTATSD